MGMSPSGIGTKNDCAGKEQQKFTRPDQLIALAFVLKNVQAEFMGSKHYS
jgi:hypothetical protein